MKENLKNEIHLNRIENIPELKKFYENTENLSFSDLRVWLKEFETLAKGSFLNNLILSELQKINQENFYTPIKATYNSIEIVNNSDYKVNLVHINSRDLLNRKFLTGFFHDKIIVSLSEKGFLYSLFRQQNKINVELLDRNQKLIEVSKNVLLGYGESILVKKHTDVFSYVGQESGEMIIALILTTKPKTSFDWEYNAETLLPYKIVGDQDDCRIEQTCKMLGELGCISSTTVLKKLLNHPKHNIRWEAMRNLMLLNFNEAISELKKLEKYPHQEVRTATKETFKLIQKYSN